MTSERIVALHTADRRLAAAVASFSEQAGVRVVEVGLDAPPEPGPVLAVLDLRGAPPGAVLPWVEASVRVVAVVDDLPAAAAVMALGAQDFAVAGAAIDEVPLRATVALSGAVDRSQGAALRRLVRHDIRSPLAVILGQCEILALGLGGPLTDKQRRSIEAVERKAQDLRTILERLADELAVVFGWEPHTRSEGSPPR